MMFKRNKHGISVLREATADDAVKTVSVTRFDDEASFPGQKAKNMICTDGALKCISSPVMCSSDVRNGRCASVVVGDELFFSSGRDICKADENGAFCVIGANVLTEEADKAYYAAGKVIFTENGTLYSVVEGAAAIEKPYIPLVATDCDDEGRTFDLNEKINILSTMVDIQFGISYEETRITPASFPLESVDGIFYPDGTKMAASDYTVVISNVGQATVTLAETTSKKLTVRGTLKNSERQKFVSAVSAFSGRTPLNEVSSSEGKKRMLAFDGVTIYLFELIGATYVPEDFVTLAADESITAVLPYDDGWFVFTANAVKRLEIDENGMTLYPFKRDFGCDMPGSAVSEKDKIIFADKNMGVYFIDRYNVGDRDVSRKISANVDEQLKEADEDDVKNATGVVAGGKYYLFCGDKVLVWDQAKRTPAASQNSEKDERKLVWYEIDGIGSVKALGAVGEKVFFCGSRGVGYLVCRATEAGSLEGKFSSGRIDAEKIGEKTAESVSVYAKIDGKSTMNVLMDGEVTPYKFSFAGEGKPRVYTVRLPARKFNSIGFEMTGKNMTLFGYEIKYYDN